MRRVSTVTGIAGVRVAILVTVDVFRLSDDVLKSKMSTITGIAEGRLAIRVTVDVFRLSDDVLNSKMSTVTGIAEGRVAILVTVDAFRLSDAVLNSKMSTVTGIAEGRVAILVTVHVFGLSHLLGNSTVSAPFAKQNKMIRTCRFLLSFARFCENISFLAQRCYKNERGGWAGRSPPHLQNIEWEGKVLLAKRYFLLSLAKICLLRSCPKKMSGGVGGSAAPPHLQDM